MSANDVFKSTDDYTQYDIEDRRPFRRSKRNLKAERLASHIEHFCWLLPKGTTYEENVGKGHYTYVGEHGKTVAMNEFLGRLTIRFPWSKKPLIVLYDNYGSSKDDSRLLLYGKAIRMVANEIKAQCLREHELSLKHAIAGAEEEMRQMNSSVDTATTSSEQAQKDEPSDSQGDDDDGDAQLEALLNADSKNFQKSSRLAEQKKAREAEEEKKKQAKATRMANGARK